MMLVCMLVARTGPHGGTAGTIWISWWESCVKWWWLPHTYRELDYQKRTRTTRRRRRWWWWWWLWVWRVSIDQRVARSVGRSVNQATTKAKATCMNGPERMYWTTSTSSKRAIYNFQYTQTKSNGRKVEIEVCLLVCLFPSVLDFFFLFSFPILGERAGSSQSNSNLGAFIDSTMMMMVIVMNLQHDRRRTMWSRQMNK